MKRYRYFIKGQVQGVGFRPFIYKSALDFKLAGFVKNDINGVEIEAEAQQKDIELFEESLRFKLPPLARIDDIQKTEIEPLLKKGFAIIQSSDDSKTSYKSALIPPDTATCQECLADIKDEKNRKYHNYFATNCTNCGPRYSIIKTVPYDRKNTSMQKFKMCRSCEEEYNNPLNRRYHAQPISCNNCGPALSLFRGDKKVDIAQKEIIQKVASLIEEGNILAIKGIGGFHIICDATNDEAVKKLREFKHRPTKPFAIMCKDLEQIKALAYVNEKEEQLLTCKEAPIVILKKLTCQNNVKISHFLAPNIDRIGCFLPYTALHHLLFVHLQNPIVATSANLGDEPIIINAENIFKKLPFVDFTLDFDRDIINGVDDSLVQVVEGKTQILRLARGYAPKVIKLPFKSEKKILAVGANAKNSIAFAMDDNIIFSPHIGDLDSMEAFGFFERTIETFKRFYDFEPDIIVHDRHPNYETTKWAKKQNKELVEVQHHLAHIYACKAEFGLRGDYLGFSFDGTGYGDEGTLWGGEVFVGDKRKYSFKPVKLLGGEKAIKEPRRVALSMLFDKLSLEEVLKLELDLVKSFLLVEIKMLHQSYVKNLNAPKSSSVGRLFDAVASFSGIAQRVSYEGESGLLCESFYDKNIEKCFDYTIDNGVIDIKIAEYMLKNKPDKKELNSMFINTLVKIIVDISKREKLEVILSGGVFQNKTLLELTCQELKQEKIKYYFQQETATNDGGIALGQLYCVFQKE
ncbi:carbamoyltransferase HypF [Sulfurimonas sp.]|uniref:carbamoyltransferase HypF n=1 Tax=Sulfurimonas sp. TaxID=2022749 RepID=UPI002618774D|nr:carbamoyltransferase HypF [Sulfurimonas sp.]MCW8896149.1 carbamoyltransferase HypF [Sulfurimonas sp.]MCW9068506.1 carbamoyltransferase HypF [Sulfurimonas sp.]